MKGEIEAALEERLAGCLRTRPNLRGITLAVAGDDGLQFGVSAGRADEGRALTIETPVRIASVTKTFVAVTLLRLEEQGRLTLGAPIGGMVGAGLSDLLCEGGYDVHAITLRHLLMHTSGMPDHADEAALATTLNDPGRVWSRAEQVRFMVEERQPLGPPGAQFSYSDTGYVLLGDVIEQVTGEGLASGVRRACRFDELGLESTWWERVEAPTSTVPRARQYLSGADVTDLDPSIDLYGGGGLVSCARDLASFMQALGRGRLFERASTLESMMNAPGQVTPTAYRMGLIPDELGGLETMGHAGFWGTSAAFVPSLSKGVSGIVLEKEGFGPMREMMGAAVAAAAAR